MTKLLPLFLFVFSLSVIGKEDTNKYLNKVLTNLEKIESASYYTQNESWLPGDTISRIGNGFVIEYNNPVDTTIGASILTYNLIDNVKQLSGGYDGKIKASVYHPEKGVMLDDFTTRKLPFRLVGRTFFSYAKNILHYVFETKDSIDWKLEDIGDSYHFKLTINESQQVEFFGKAYHMDIPAEMITDPTSIYEFWISKSDDLPYKIRREMDHQTTVTTCRDVEFNKLSIKDFNLSDYFPKGYEVRKLWEQKKQPQNPEKSELIGKKAANWALNSIDKQIVSLATIKSKVVLINFTGMGCGPCKMAIPFLVNLRNELASKDVEIISIEIWGGQLSSLQNYAKKNGINYTFLEGNEQVIKDYLNGSRGVPLFFILDEQRIIRKIIKGYGGEQTNTEIRDTIKEFL